MHSTIVRHALRVFLSLAFIGPGLAQSQVPGEPPTSTGVVSKPADHVDFSTQPADQVKDSLHDSKTPYATKRDAIRDLARKALREKADVPAKPKKGSTPKNQAVTKDGAANKADAADKDGAPDNDDTPDQKKDATSVGASDEFVASGLGLDAGVGYFFGEKHYATVFKVKYNFYQNWTNVAATTDAGATKSLSSEDSSKLKLKRPFVVLGSFAPDSISGWVGTCPKLGSRDGSTTGSAAIAGLAFGWGPFHKGDPTAARSTTAANLDIGVALSNTTTLRHSQLYLGVSTDLAVFQKLVSSISDAGASDADKATTGK